MYEGPPKPNDSGNTEDIPTIHYIDQVGSEILNIPFGAFAIINHYDTQGSRLG